MRARSNYYVFLLMFYKSLLGLLAVSYPRVLCHVWVSTDCFDQSSDWVVLVLGGAVLSPFCSL